MAKECQNCKAVGRKKTLRYTTKSIKDKSGGSFRRAYYECPYCGFEVRA